MPQTLHEWLIAAESALAAAGRDDARVAAEWLVAAAAGIGRLDVVMQRDCLLDAPARERLAGWVSRMARGEPLQYVLGTAPFLGREMLSDPRALIPRPETEELCERILADDAIWRKPAPRLADVGTGAGCIAVTIAVERPSAVVTAIDISPDALALARENARRFDVEQRIDWRRRDLLSGFPPRSLDAVVSNPPYVAEAEWSQLDPSVRDYEPRLALVGGEDGLSVIRRLIGQARQVLSPGGRLWMEIGNEQGPAVFDLLAMHGFAEIAIRRDLSGLDRFAEARQPDV